MDLAPTQSDDIRYNAIRQTCGQCGHTFRLDLIGLAAITDIVCPACSHTFRHTRATLRNIHKRIDKAVKFIQNAGSAEKRANAESVSNEIARAKAKPLRIARIIDPMLD